jgi:DNA polymerase elongation subunit (family B)
MEFGKLIPVALEIARKYVRLIRTGKVPAEKLALGRRLSKSPEEYASLSHQAIAAQQLGREGRYIHAGQNIRYVVTAYEAAIKDNRAVHLELLDEEVRYDKETYVKLIIMAFVNLFLPLGYDASKVREIL